MLEGGLIEKIFKKIKDANAAKTVLCCMVIAASLIVFLFSGSMKKHKNEEAAEHSKAESELGSAAMLENKLEAILSSMRGAGRVRVMLTLDRTNEQVVASSEKTASGENSSSRESKPATVQSGGREEAIVLTEVFPRIRGVIVMAEGAGDIGVKFALISAVSTVLGIDEKNVEVFVMAE